MTAQKRSEQVNRVGLSITAIGGDQLRARGIASVADLTQAVPGLTFATTQTNTPVYTLRGVGFNDQSLSGYPTVSVYVDQVPLPFPALTTEAGLDIERIEVLKGPQGVLFGQNSTGGAINYIAAKPTSHLEAGTDFGFSRFNTFSGDAYISGPISDNLLFRVAVRDTTGDGWQRSYTRNDTLGATQEFAGRLLLDWKPTDKIKFELNVNGWINDSQPQAGQFIKIDQQVPANQPALFDYPLAPHDPRAADWSNSPERPNAHDSFFQASLRGDYDLTDDITLTSITSYIRYKRNEFSDVDGVSLNDYDLAYTGDIRSFTQEVRLANSGTDRLRYTVGGNYEKSTVREAAEEFYHDGSIGVVDGFDSNGYIAAQKLKNYAGFANLAFDVTSRFTIKGGARYTENQRSSSNCAVERGDPRILPVFEAVSSAVRGGAPTPPIPIGGCLTLNQQELPGLIQNRLNQHNISWSGGVDYRATPTTLLYVNITKGYKAGSIPDITASTYLQYEPVQQESVIDYEGGFKVQLFDRKLYVTGAGFYYSYRNKQVLGHLVDPVFGPLETLINIPKSDIKGGEVSLTANPTRGLSLTGSVTYVDATILRYSGLNAELIPTNFAGSPIPLTPKWTATAGIDYNFPINERYSLFVGADGNYASATHAILGTEDVTRIDSYALLNLRAGIETKDGKWRLTAFGKNVTNKYYWTAVIKSSDTWIRYAGRPATYGVTLGLKFR